MEMNNDVLEKVEGLMADVEDKETFLRSLVIRNSKDIFSFISLIKLHQDKGYYFGIPYSMCADIVESAEDFSQLCKNYQFGETESGREFYNDFRKAIEEEILN